MDCAGLCDEAAFFVPGRPRDVGVGDMLRAAWRRLPKLASQERSPVPEARASNPSRGG